MYTDLLALYRMAEVCRDRRMREAERERLIRACRGQQRRPKLRPRFRVLLERVRAIGGEAYLQRTSGPKAPEQAAPTAGMLHT